MAAAAHGARCGRMAGKTALITGAAGDIGQAIARRFVQEGACVACAELSEPLAMAAVSALDAHPDSVLALACDVTSGSAAQDAVAAVEARFGALHVLVNNAAAVSPYVPVDELNETAWRHALDVNLTGAFLMSKFAVPAIRRAGGGAIVHVASQMGHVGKQGRAAYGVTKAALIHLARIMALDHAADGIRVNSLSPGAVLTSRVVARYGSAAAALEALRPAYPLRRIASADEVAHAALFLVADEASFVTGTDLLVDGGYTAQ